MDKGKPFREKFHAKRRSEERRVGKSVFACVDLGGRRIIKKKRMKRNEDSLRDLWDNIKHNNIHITGVQEGEKREKGPEKIFEEIIVDNFPIMGKEIATQVQDRKSVV